MALNPRAYVHAVHAPDKVFEDNCYTDDTQRMYIISDGMSGKSGEDASGFTTSVVGRRLSAALDQNRTTGEKKGLEQLLPPPLLEAQRSARRRGHGATLDVAIVDDHLLNLFHLGDSFVWLFDEDNRLHQVTKEHSEAGALLERRMFRSSDEVYISRHRNNTGPLWYIGKEGLDISEVLPITTLTKGDDVRKLPDITLTQLDLNAWKARYVIMATDGLIARVTEEEIQELLATYNPQREFPEDLFARIEDRIRNPRALVELARRYGLPEQNLRQDDTQIVLIDLYNQERRLIVDLGGSVVSHQIELARRGDYDAVVAERDGLAKRVVYLEDNSKIIGAELPSALEKVRRITEEKAKVEQEYRSLDAAKKSVEASLESERTRADNLQTTLDTTIRSHTVELERRRTEYESSLREKDALVRDLSTRLSERDAQYKGLEIEYGIALGTVKRVLGELRTAKKQEILDAKTGYTNAQMNVNNIKLLVTVFKQTLEENDEKYTGLKKRVDESSLDEVKEDYGHIGVNLEDVRKKIAEINLPPLTASLAGIAWAEQLNVEEVTPNQISMLPTTRGVYQSVDSAMRDMTHIQDKLISVSNAMGVLEGRLAMSEREATLRGREEDVSRRETDVREYEQRLHETNGWLTRQAARIRGWYQDHETTINLKRVGAITVASLLIGSYWYSVSEIAHPTPIKTLTTALKNHSYPEKEKRAEKGKNDEKKDIKKEEPKPQKTLSAYYYPMREGYYMAGETPGVSYQPPEDAFEEQRLYIVRSGIDECYRAAVKEEGAYHFVDQRGQRAQLGKERYRIFTTLEAANAKFKPCDERDTITQPTDTPIITPDTGTGYQAQPQGRKEEQEFEGDLLEKIEEGRYRVTENGGRKRITELLPGRETVYVQKERGKCYDVASKNRSVYWGNIISITTPPTQQCSPGGTR